MRVAGTWQRYHEYNHTQRWLRCYKFEIGKNRNCFWKLASTSIFCAQVDPPGLVSNVKVTISFHPLFVTKVDRGFELSCFYMEANKTATYPLIVNTVSLEPLTDVAEMPRCTYQVLEGGPDGKEATVVTVGNPVYHKWNCVSSAPGEFTKSLQQISFLLTIFFVSADLWCMTVHSCFVEDGSGTKVEILNDEGCAVDKYILNNLDYQSPLTAGKEAHAFKFADKVFVNFQCSMRLDIKNGECKVQNRL